MKGRYYYYHADWKPISSALRFIYINDPNSGFSQRALRWNNPVQSWEMITTVLNPTHDHTASRLMLLVYGVPTISRKIVENTSKVYPDFAVIIT